MSPIKDKLFPIFATPLYRRTTVIVALSITMFCGIYLTQIGTTIENQTARRLDFFLRSALNHDPPLDKRIRIFAFDDRSSNKIGYSDLPISGWGVILEALAKNKPGAIFIDKVFGLLLKPEHTSDFVSRLKQYQVPIIGGMFISPATIRDREQLPLDRPEFDAAGLLAKGSKLRRVRWLTLNRGYPYGPARSIERAFTYLGHLDYISPGSVEVFKRISEDNVIPHFSLFAADKFAIATRHVVINDRKITMPRSGQVLVNLADSDSYYERTESLLNLIVKIKRGEIEALVNPGDTVVILPFMFTGNTDFKETLLGKMPGGFIMTAMINSVLTGQWLTQLEFIPGLIILAILLAAVLAIKLNTKMFIVSCVSGSLFLILSGIGFFVFASMVIPWLFPTLAYAASGVAIFIEKSRLLEQKSKKLRDALSGMISQEKLDKIMQNPAGLRIDPSEQVITLMFIDIVGFSRVAENKNPREVFGNLKAIIDDLTLTIHKHNGVVDKTIGDAILCYFGYEFNRPDSVTHHADQALRCAIEIQTKSLARTLAHQDDSQGFINPFRIGVNTAASYIGDIGGDQRIEFSIIGNGVNFAKRLEEVCESYRIMLGATSRDLLFQTDRNANMQKRHIQIKHHEKLLEAYEYNPFHDEPEILEKALRKYNKVATYSRKDQRWLVTGVEIFAHSSICRGKIVNFSRSGFAVSLDTYLAKGVQMEISLSSSGSNLRQRCELAGLGSIFCTVRWGRRIESGYLHGVELVRLNPSLLETLFTILKEEVSVHSELQPLVG